MWPLALTHGALALCVGLLTWQGAASHFGAQLAAEHSQQAAALAAAAADAQRQQAVFQTQLQEARNAAIKREAALRRDVGAARDALYGLRGAAERARRELPGYSAAAAAGVAGTATELLAQCAAAYRDVAESADAHAADALTLQQAWPVQAAVSTESTEGGR